MARSGVNDARTRIILKEINEIRSKLEDVLFKVSSVENCVEDIRANNNATNNGGHNRRSGKKSEGGIGGWERIMRNKFPHLHCYFPPALWKEAILHSAFEHIHSTTSSNYERNECIVALSGVLFARKNHGKKSLFGSLSLIHI